MDERALLLLGLLKAQRQHGYQVHDFIERNLSRITDMKRPTAYAILERLHKAGLIAEEVEQEGNRPPRRVYSVTAEGEAAYRSLLLANLSQADGMNHPGDVGLMFLNEVEPAEAIACLQGRLSQVEGRITALEATPSHGCESSVDLAIGRQIQLLRCDRDWLTTTIARLQDRLAR